MALKLAVISLVLVVFCTAQQFYTNARYGKRDDIRKIAYGNVRQGRSDAKVDVAVRNDRFFLGSRYGKRNSQLHTAEQNLGRKFDEYSSRNEAFFYGSRYGKRAEDVPFENENSFLEPDQVLTKEKSQFSMNCVYIGIGALYNCAPSTFLKETKTSDLSL